VNYIVNKKISQILLELLDYCKTKQQVSIADIMSLLHQYSFSLCLIIFALPCVLPLPAVSFFGGIPLMLFAIQMIMGYDAAWIPLKISKKTILSSHIEKVITKSVPYLTKAESFFKFSIAIKNIDFAEKLVGVFALIFAIYITLPVIFGNSLPSFGIILMALGLLKRDYLLIIIGVISGAIGIVLASAVIFGGLSLIDKLYHYLLNYFI
jgi:hypothetical protein